MVLIVEGVVNKDTEDAGVENERFDESRSAGSERFDESRSAGSGGAGAINPVLGTEFTEHTSAGTFSERDPR